MKQLLLLIIATILVFSVKAQTTSLEFVNNTIACTVYVQIHADVANSCGTGQTSSVIAVLPSSTQTFSDASTIPGLSLSAGDYFYYADIWEENPSIATTCGSRNSIDIGDCANANWMLDNYDTDISGCNGPCPSNAVISISYNPGALPHPQITFN